MGEYVTKDGDVLFHGVTEEEFIEKIAKGGKKVSPYAEVLMCQTLGEAEAVVQRVDPRAWVNNGDRIRDNLRYQFTETFPAYLFYLFIFHFLFDYFYICAYL